MSYLLSILISTTLFFSSTLPALAIGNASISLPSDISAQTGSIITVPVMVNTDGEPTGGIDVILIFDKNVLQLTDITTYPENSNNILKQFLTAQFNDNPQHASEIQLISDANNAGIFAFSAIAGVFESFNGVMSEANPLATVSFKVLNTTPTTVSFQFTPGSTADTNMPNLEATRDLLKQANNLKVNQPSSPTPSPKVGDLDNNSYVDIFDYNQLLADFGKTGSQILGDIDKNSQVDIFDYNILLSNFGF